jgi:hypothetical protein
VLYTTWGVASAYIVEDLLCACLKSYGPNVVLLNCSDPVLVYDLPVWGFMECFRRASRCITYHIQVACAHQGPPGPKIELPQSAHCKYKTCHVTVIKPMYAATAADD